MQIAQAFNPLNVVGMGANQTFSPYDNSTAPTEPTPNPYNGPADGWFVRNLSAGIVAQKPIKLVLEGNPGGQNLGNILKNPHIQAVGYTVGVSAAVHTGLSIFKQGRGLIKGEQTGAGAAANIITDAVRGTGAGLGAYAGGSISAVAMKAFGATGTFGTIVSTLGAIYGATVGAEIVESTGLRDRLLGSFGAA
ncbi:MAG: hypothetical protein IGS03_05730 [Candidatus Sericytochromatia bacterium]|nr:hypothetical protein [Candidatus Sericytochromatia bacterium]